MGRPVVTTALVVALFATHSPTEATAQMPTAHHRQHVLNLLRAKRGFPTRKALLRSGRIAETNKILTEMAESRTLSFHLKLNSIRALEYFPTKRTEDVLMTMLFARRQSATFKRTILRSLARAFGVKLYFEFLPFLHDPHPTVRAGAATALGEIDDGRVSGVLRNQLVREKELTVRLALEDAMAMVAARERKKHYRITPGE